MSFPDLTRAKRAVSRVLAFGSRKRPGADDRDEWLRRDPRLDLEAAKRHLDRALAQVDARDTGEGGSGEYHVANAASRLLLVLERLERRK